MEATGKRYITHGSRADSFLIWYMADLHLLSANCAEKELRKDVEKIKNDPFSFWIGGGDYAEYIGHTDARRFDPDCASSELMIKDLGRLGTVSQKKVLSLLLPIKHKCLGMGMGNHELKYQQHQSQSNLHEELCRAMECPNLGYSGFFDIVFVRGGAVKTPVLTLNSVVHGKTQSSQFRVFYHHGAGGALSSGGKLNRLIRFMREHDADMYFIGHVHEKIAKRENPLGASASCTKIVHKDHVGVITGSYLKTYQQGTISYGEQGGYSPVTLGAAWIRVKPSTRELAAEV